MIILNSTGRVNNYSLWYLLLLITGIILKLLQKHTLSKLKADNINVVNMVKICLFLCLIKN